MATAALSQKAKRQRTGTKVYFQIVLEGEIDTIEECWEEQDEYPQFDSEWKGTPWTEDRALELVQYTANGYGGVYELLSEWNLLDTDTGTITISLTPFHQQSSI